MLSTSLPRLRRRPVDIPSAVHRFLPQAIPFDRKESATFTPVSTVPTTTTSIDYQIMLETGADL